jgi:hypothetical protein
MKILLIVFGSIFGLMLIAVIAIAILVGVYGKKMLANATNPANERATAAKIADFTLPVGFHITTATDMGIAQTVLIGPIDRKSDSMRLQLTGQHLPSSDPDKLAGSVESSLTFTEKLVQCDLKEQPDDTIAVSGETIRLRVLRCDHSPRPLTFEIGIIKAKASTVQITASNVTSARDHAALVSFVKSIH